MVIDSKAKGKRWEKDAVEILNTRFPSTWKRVPASGALGTQLNMPDLTSDLVGAYYFLPFKIRADAKTGYGGATQLALKREWLDKIRKEAENIPNSVPCVLGKFSGSRGEEKHFIVLDFQAWEKLLESIEELYQENIKIRDNLEKGYIGKMTEPPTIILEDDDHE